MKKIVLKSLFWVIAISLSFSMIGIISYFLSSKKEYFTDYMIKFYEFSLEFLVSILLFGGSSFLLMFLLGKLYTKLFN